MKKLLSSITINACLAFLLTSCTTDEPRTEKPNQTQSLTEKANSLKTRAACVVENGQWKKVGLLGHDACVLATSDAGKACTDSKQCQVACVTNKIDIPAGKKVTGQCYESTSQFGCRTYINNGVAEPTLCID